MALLLRLFILFYFLGGVSLSLSLDIAAQEQPTAFWMCRFRSEKPGTRYTSSSPGGQHLETATEHQHFCVAHSSNTQSMKPASLLHECYCLPGLCIQLLNYKRQKYGRKQPRSVTWSPIKVFTAGGSKNTNVPQNNCSVYNFNRTCRSHTYCQKCIIKQPTDNVYLYTCGQ